MMMTIATMITSTMIIMGTTTAAAMGPLQVSREIKTFVTIFEISVKLCKVQHARLHGSWSLDSVPT